ncbi:hypothetical protein [Streptomyces palmae]|uniref:Uncharacterized protein n=1 Tax=Streptomyces palmae TaxID=1701085 RepID=A0A4Z0FRB5_9ACTN|nr:hypothetical protein [Streptomyces palmae]TGA84391.1 hypothetical protein E4099_31445 [Streptomyces palmae]
MVKAGVHSSGSRTADRHPPGREHGALMDGGAGRRCDLVTVPARQGLEAVDILRLRRGVGPVLHDGSCDTLGFLVPPGTADRWDLPGSACTETYGHEAAVEPGTAAPPPVTGTGWLVPPDAAIAEATDPEVLRQALGEAARTIEAVDRCQ